MVNDNFEKELFKYKHNIYEYINYLCINVLIKYRSCKKVKI